MSALLNCTSHTPSMFFSREMASASPLRVCGARSTCVMSPATTISGSRSHTGQKHLHLRDGGILRLVQDDERLVQRPASHVGQRNNLDRVLLHVLLDLLVVHHFVQRILQGTQIGIDLRLQIAGQETQTLACLDGRPHQHDLADFMVPQPRPPPPPPGTSSPSRTDRPPASGRASAWTRHNAPDRASAAGDAGRPTIPR